MYSMYNIAANLKKVQIPQNIDVSCIPTDYVSFKLDSTAKATR